jgi:hypothetical protein
MLTSSLQKLANDSDPSFRSYSNDDNSSELFLPFLRKIDKFAALEISHDFSVSQYLQFIDRYCNETSIHDCMTFFRLIIDGFSLANSITVGGGGEDGGNSRKDGNIRNFRYFKYKKIPSVRSLTRLICVNACQMGSALLNNTDVEIPEVAKKWEEEASGYLSSAFNSEGSSAFSSISQLLTACTIVIGTEISNEPVVRHFARQVFRSRGSISTSPTSLGKSTITPYSQYYGIHVIENKPISQFFTKRGLLLFMSMIEAESLGLIEISINAPQRQESAEKYVQDLSPLFEKLRLFQLMMPPPTSRKDDIKISWDFIRLQVLQVTIEKYLLPFLKADVRSELMKLGKEAIADEACSEFSKRLKSGPCGPFYEDTREFSMRSLLSCPNRFIYASVVSLYVTQDASPSLHMACVDINGVITAHGVIASQSMGQKKDKIKTFLYDNQPGCVVINSSGGSLSREVLNMINSSIISEISEMIDLDRRLKRQAMNMDDNDEEEEEEANSKYTPQVILFMTSFFFFFAKFFFVRLLS